VPVECGNCGGAVSQIDQLPPQLSWHSPVAE
jgi:hypothetical protein